MLYPEKEFPLTEEQWKNPPSVYRGTPFWAWNTALRPEVLKEQIDVFRKMGFGGFHMHVRQGLETPYLSEEFLDAVRLCAREAKERSMYAWLYDEDRWPSGDAGGEVTKVISRRQKFLTMTVTPLADAGKTVDEVRENGAPLFLGAFEVLCDGEGALISYRRLAEGEPSDSARYFYCLTASVPEERFNGQTYVDTLSKEALSAFIDSTHKVYQKALGDDFGTVCPAIFTDEPQTILHRPMKNGNDREDVRAPWTWDFADTYEKEFGENILDRLPEIFFTDRTGRGKDLRYRYKRHINERFCEAFPDQIGDWCRENGMRLTGHVMGEDTLLEGAMFLGDVMTCYRRMEIPGMDLLYDDRAFQVAVQCRSAVRQFGREGMLSELYGVTGWDFDFRGYKFQGDWQACLGVTVRVPHLAWMTMKGEGKRDYPAPIFYQSPWWEDFSYVEDHFARVNLALTRGKPAVRVAVVRPIDTYCMYYAQDNLTSDVREEINERYQTLAKWLLCGSVDFDYLSEGLLPELCKEGTNPLKVGEMTYDAVIVPDCETLRTHTLNLLKRFAENGGALFFTGRTPEYEEGLPSEKAKAIVSLGRTVGFSKTEILRELASFRDVTLRERDGRLCDRLLYTLRREGENAWLFVAHAEKPVLPALSPAQPIEIVVEGNYLPSLIDTQTGEFSTPNFTADGEKTHIYITLFDYNSLLFKLEKTEKPESFRMNTADERKKKTPIALTGFGTSDPNVLLLDMAEWSVDGGAYQPEDEITRIDAKVRRTLGLPIRQLRVIQPWAIAQSPEDHVLSLRFTFESRIEVKNAELGVENPEKTKFTFNGEDIPTRETGWYVDHDIRKIALPTVRKGKNVLTLTFPFGRRSDVENVFILGDFGVTGAGRKTAICEKPTEVAFGDLTRQGYFFYGGNFDYRTEFSSDGTSDYELTVNEFRGAGIRVRLDGKDLGMICYPPYCMRIPQVSAGNHRLTVSLLGNRYNTFSAIHNMEDDKPRVYMGPTFWRCSDKIFSYEYRVRALGILNTPILCRVEKIGK